MKSLLNNNIYSQRNTSKIPQLKKNNNTDIINKFNLNIYGKNIVNDFKYQYNPFIKRIKLLKKNTPTNNSNNISNNKVHKIFRDNYLIQKESLLTSTSTNFDIVKAQLFKKNSHNKSFDTYLNNSSLKQKKDENEKQLLFEKIKTKEYRINQIKNINKILKLNQTKDNISKNEIKLIKVKMHKILKENDNKICNTFTKKNNSFNKKLRNYFKSDKFIKKKILQNSNFSTTKKDFYSSHNLLDYYLDFDKDLYNDDEFITKAVINSFSEREKKIISLSPKYFSIHKKKNLLKRLKINLNETLKDKLQKEEKIEKLKNKEIILSQKPSENDNNNIKNVFKKKLNKKIVKYFYGKIMDQKLKKKNNSLIKEDKKKSLSAFFDKEIKNYYNKYYLFCTKNTKNSNFKKNDDYYKMFNYPINYNMTKEFILFKNNERLNKEEQLHNLRKINKKNNDYINNTISKFQEIMKKNYLENKL